MNTTETALGLDEAIRAEGQPLGRFNWVPACGQYGRGFNWDVGDWLPAPDGTHDGYIWRLGFYTLQRGDQ